MQYIATFIVQLRHECYLHCLAAVSSMITN